MNSQGMFFQSIPILTEESSFREESSNLNYLGLLSSVISGAIGLARSKKGSDLIRKMEEGGSELIEEI